MTVLTPNGGSLRIPGTKGRASALLEWRILETARHYVRLTVRQLYYIIISKYGYTPSRNFYKVLDYHLTKMRRMNRDLHAKFIDPTRHFIPAPRPYPEIELWVEKDSIRNFLDDLAAKYRLSIQVLRGFASLSMFRKALLRASKRSWLITLGFHGDSSSCSRRISASNYLTHELLEGFRLLFLVLVGVYEFLDGCSDDLVSEVSSDPSVPEVESVDVVVEPGVFAVW